MCERGAFFHEIYESLFSKRKKTKPRTVHWARKMDEKCFQSNFTSGSIALKTIYCFLKIREAGKQKASKNNTENKSMLVRTNFGLSVPSKLPHNPRNLNHLCLYIRIKSANWYAVYPLMYDNEETAGLRLLFNVIFLSLEIRLYAWTHLDQHFLYDLSCRWTKKVVESVICLFHCP